MKVNLINKPKKVTIKEGARKGEEVVIDNFYLVADNGTTLSIEPAVGHYKDDDNLNKAIRQRNVIGLRLLADRVEE